MTTNEPPPSPETDERPFCDYVEGPTQARCHKEPGHTGPHNGWAHYPGQVVSWEDVCAKPRRYFSQQTCELPRGHAGDHEDATHLWENEHHVYPPGPGASS